MTAAPYWRPWHENCCQTVADSRLTNVAMYCQSSVVIAISASEGKAEMGRELVGKVDPDSYCGKLASSAIEAMCGYIVKQIKQFNSLISSTIMVVIDKIIMVVIERTEKDAEQKFLFFC